MPNWSDLLNEIDANKSPDSTNAVRYKYLKQLHDLRKRNIVTYYSGWMHRPEHGVHIDDLDKCGFMTVIHKLDRTKGLDLLLHTPGGVTSATQSLVDYLQSIFGSNIEVFIPQIAMSAGTMIACAARKIHMGLQSSLGPIDPQLGRVGARLLLKEFQKIQEEVSKDPSKLNVWLPILGQYRPTTIEQCKDLIQWSEEMIRGWLKNGMFADDKDSKKKIDKIVVGLSRSDITMAHDRHISVQEASDMGLKISRMEGKDNDELQDAVLSVHHTYMHTLATFPILKMVENHNSVAYVIHQRNR